MNNSDRFLILLVLVTICIWGTATIRRLDRIEAHLAQPYRKLPEVKP